MTSNKAVTTGRVMHGRSIYSRMTIDPRIPAQCRDGVRRVSTDQADIACTKREAPWGVRRVALRVSCILLILRTACEADLRMDDSFNDYDGEEAQ